MIAEDELHEVPALQWAYAALAVMTKDETIYRRWNLEVEWFRRAMPTIGRLLEEAIARDKATDAMLEGQK